MMPGLGGVDICRTVRTRNRPEPHYLILLTSLKEKKDIVAGLGAGTYYPGYFSEDRKSHKKNG